MTTLSPLNAIAVTPRAWDDRAPRQRQAERIGDIQSVVCKIIGNIERNIRRGASIDQVAPVVAAWAGHLSKLVTVVELRAHGVLVLCALHPAVVMELKPKTYRLLADLKTTGIKEVRFQ